jgi:hypothetical protein
MRALVLLVALVAGLAAPARAGDDVAAAQTVIRAQVDAFGRDDAATAYSYAAPAIRSMFPQADIFIGMVKRKYTGNTPRSIATGASNLARRRCRTARSRSAFTSSTPMARRGRRCTRWSNNPTAA